MIQGLIFKWKNVYIVGRNGYDLMEIGPSQTDLTLYFTGSCALLIKLAVDKLIFLLYI